MHEYGHWLIDHYRLDTLKLYQKLFVGESESYVCDVIKYWIKEVIWGRLFGDRPDGLVSHYACVNAEEDFCETLSFMLTCPERMDFNDRRVVRKTCAILVLLQEHCC